ncbi:micos subunit MIC26 [Podospora australis]|uniref:MICOS complex subunit n=1 Tax=Podospora australis TaxID=1536484 RepID=A0AAN6WUH5_9PEZI|nr:micos subunit MIC26 [Podospora australis]
MAARVLFQRRGAPLTAAVLVGGIAFYPQIAHADAPNDRQFSRKPIYDDDFDLLPPTKAAPPPSLPPSSPVAAAPTTPTAVVPAAPSTSIIPTSEQQQQPATITIPSHVTRGGRSPVDRLTDQLASQIRLARLFLHAQAATAEDAVNAGMSRAFALEQSFTSTVASLAPPRESGEKLMPGLIYVLVAGMAGTIVARNRNILLRGVTPLALGLTAAYTVLPITMGNVGELAWHYEKKFPAVADAHLKTREGIEKSVYFAKVHADLAQRKVHEGVTEAREVVEGWIRKGK